MSGIPETIHEVCLALGIKEQKWLNLQAGLTFFSSWMEDQVLGGVARLESDGGMRLEEAAARLSDYQLVTPAGRLRGLAKQLGQTGWEDVFIDELGYWNLVVNVLRSPERAQPGQLAAFLVTIGVRVPKDYFLRPTVQHSATWICVGRSTGVTDRLYDRSTYWTKLEEPRLAVQIQYNYGKPVPANGVYVGSQIEATVSAYPGGLPGRIVLPERYSVQLAQKNPAAYSSIQQWLVASKRDLSLRPWLRESLIALREIVPVLRDGKLFVVDATGTSLSCTTHSEKGEYYLVGIARGEPIQVFGLKRGRSCVLFSAIKEGIFYTL